LKGAGGRLSSRLPSRCQNEDSAVATTSIL
jgi:hypothetical protein